MPVSQSQIETQDQTQKQTQKQKQKQKEKYSDGLVYDNDVYGEVSENDYYS